MWDGVWGGVWGEESPIPVHVIERGRVLTNTLQDVLYVAEGYINYSLPGGWIISNDG